MTYGKNLRKTMLTIKVMAMIVIAVVVLMDIIEARYDEA